MEDDVLVGDASGCIHLSHQPARVVEYARSPLIARRRKPTPVAFEILWCGREHMVEFDDSELVVKFEAASEDREMD